MSAASGWLNLALYSSDLRPAINPRIMVTVTQTLQGTSRYGSTLYPNNFGLQMNCFCPVAPAVQQGRYTGWQQYVLETNYNTPTQSIDDLTWITNASGLLAYSFSYRPAVLPSPVPSGYSFEFLVATDPTTMYTTSGTFNIYDGPALLDSNELLTSQMSNYGSFTGGGWPNSVCAITMEIVGPGSTSTTFTSGAGEIRYYPSGGQSYDIAGLIPGTTYYDFPAGLDAANNTIHTAEQSNMQYSAITQQADGSYLQYFSWNGVFPGTPQPTQTTITVAQA